MREQIGHLERAAHRLGALADTRLRLLHAIEREDAEGDRHAGLERRELQTARSFARDVVEVRRVTADDATERDDAREATRLREGSRGQRQLERARYDHDRDRVLAYSCLGELRERTVEELARDAAVEPRDDHADGTAAALGAAFENPHTVPDGEV